VKTIDLNKADEKQHGALLIIFSILLLVILLLIGSIYGLLLNASYQQIIWLALLLLFVLSSMGMLLLISGFSLFLLWYTNNVPRPLERILTMLTPLLYPIIERLGKALGYDKNFIRKAYASISNKLTFSKSFSFNGEEVLVLSPHCIQRSDCCLKLTNDINNCIRCGQCHVNELMILSEKYGVRFSLVSGGTIARQLILNMKPKAIVAIACERDLISGLKDVRRIPVIGIINIRPEGPCRNTLVDVKEVEKAIIHFIGG
jgi:hypothetical protein